MKDMLHFQFGQFWLLAAVGLGVLAGFAIAPHCIRSRMRKAPGTVTYAVLGMMLGSLCDRRRPDDTEGAAARYDNI